MSVLRVVVVRTGGFAGLTRTAEVDDPDSAERLSEAVLGSADRESDRRARDAFLYRFTLIRESDEQTVDLGESALDADLRHAIRALFSP